jgi:FkbM family methyltransferase
MMRVDAIVSVAHLLVSLQAGSSIETFVHLPSMKNASEPLQQMALTFSEIKSRESRESITFDRSTGAIEGATAREKMLVRAFQAGARVSSAWTHRGFGIGCKMLRPMLTKKVMQVRLNDDAIFSYPFGDEYWSTILDRAYCYEKDIDVFFRNIADCDYTFVDCGANFGYWSTLISSRPYGSHPSIAIEPSSNNFAILKNNANINGNRFSLLKTAIGEASGTARLSGCKHESMSIARGANDDGEEVALISLDDLMDRMNLAQRRCVVKLDVEGFEIEALKGGQRLLLTDCVVICEDHGNDRHHSVSRYILEETPLNLYCYDPALGHYVRLLDLSPLDRIKKAVNRGYNVLATASSFWEGRILALNR